MPAGSSIDTARPWHAVAPQGVLEALQTSEQGLDPQQAQQRRQTFGPNRLPKGKRAGPLRVFLRQFKDPLIYILLIAGAVSASIGSFNNAIFIFAVLLINAGIGTYQEWKAEASAEALQEAIDIEAKVRRGGQTETISGTELVPGDIIEIESGAAVPADARLLSATDLRTDESMLTGESVPVDKDAEAELEEDTPLGDRRTLIHAGSTAVAGRGVAVVCRTGTGSEVGQIAEALERKGEAPPLVVRLRTFTRRIALLVLAAVILLSAVQLIRGTDPVEIFFLGVALAVSAIPAGLPVAITVALARASARMARRNVIVRQLPAVEGLGACTLIASDKTGTLTANQLTITRVELHQSGRVDISGQGYDTRGELQFSEDEASAKDALHRLTIAGMLANEGSLHVEGNRVERQGDSMDVAFLILGCKQGLAPDELVEQQPQVGFIPFESDRRYAAAFHEVDDGVRAYVKGAAQTVVGMCKDVDADAISKAEDELAGHGFRVLALAAGTVGEKSGGEYGEDRLHDLEFLGLVGIIDPVREAVPEAVRRCHSAGVEVRMITGDHPATGLAIARDIGIADENSQAVTGNDIRGSDAQVHERLREAAVFARVEPTQKTDIVEELQAAGHFVAVTGDGVNDAPALERANIGVAMGEAGTDVARQAADLILTDDNFASIVGGIEEGRIAYDNVRRVTWLLLSTGAAEVLLFFVALFVGLPLPLTPVQLLWLNLVTNGVQDVALAFERGDDDVLERPPRPPDQPVFNRQMIQQTLLSGGYIGAVAFGVYFYLIRVTGMDEFSARNILLLLMVLFENAHAFSCRSETRSLFQIPLRSNPLLVLAVILAQGIHIASMFIPGLSDVLGTEPVSFTQWLTLIPIAASLLVFDEIAKLVHRRLERRQPQAT